MKILTLVSTLFLSLFLSTSILQAEKEAEVKGYLYLQINLPAGRTEAQVQAAIERAFNGRRWIVTEKTSDKVIGELNHRGYEARLTVVYNASEIKFYDDSYKLRKGKKTNTYSNDQTYKRVKSSPDGWLRNLEKDIKRFLNVPLK